MDTRTITDITPRENDPGHFTMHLSDGSTANVAGSPIESNDGGVFSFRLEIMSPNGELTGDGPILDRASYDKLVAFGATLPPFKESDAPKSATPAPIPAAAAPTTDAPPDAPAATPAAPIPVTTEHVDLLERVIADIKSGAKYFVHEIEHLLHTA